MRVSFAYLGRSRMLESSAGNGRTLSMMPNLAREKVSFDAPLLHPLRFREAMSALHDVVINDLRYQPRDKTAYEEWKKEQTAAKQAIYRRELEREAGSRDATGADPTTAGLRGTLRADSQALLGGAVQTRGFIAARRSGTVALADAVRPGDHRGRRRGILRVLLGG